MLLLMPTAFMILIVVPRECDPRELYDPLGLIGRGSYGSVFRARDRRSGELVAIKVVHYAYELHCAHVWSIYTSRILGWPCMPCSLHAVPILIL